MLSSATLALNEIIGRKGELLFLPLFVPQIVIRLINVFRMLFQPFLACTLKTCDIFPLGAKRPICVHTCPCHKFTLSFRILQEFSYFYPSKRIQNGHFSKKQTNDTFYNKYRMFLIYNRNILRLFFPRGRSSL